MNVSSAAWVAGSMLDARLEMDVTDQSQTWIASHLNTELDPVTGRAVVTAIRQPATLADDLYRAGITVFDEGGELINVRSMLTPVTAAFDGGHIALYPRLRGRDGVEDIRCGAGRWDESLRAWIIDMAEAAPILRHPSVVPYPYAPAVLATAAMTHTNPLPGDGTVLGLRGIRLETICQLEPDKIAGLNALGYENAFDVLYSKPRAYVETSSHTPIGPDRVGDEVAILAEVLRVDVPEFGSKRPTTVHARDHITGTIVSVPFFRGAWVARSVHPGTHVVVVGKLELFRNRPQITGALLDVVRPEDAFDPDARVVGIYNASGKNDITTWDVRRVAKTAAARLPELYDPIPKSIIERRGLMDRRTAISALHSPESINQAEAARMRLAYEELFRWQVVIAMNASAERAHPAWVLDAPGTLRESMIAAKPYPLTGAQRRVIDEIVADMATDKPMNRLLQGEVGSGKTAVTAQAIAQAVESGVQAALMVPLDDLASQHYTEIRAELPDSIRVELLAKGVTGAKARKIREALAAGEVDVVVGTSSLISEATTFNKLGLVVIDEQHRFGVEQRRALADKGREQGRTPDLLASTATPAPRTALMTTFGDMDVSIIDEMPPGRSTVDTAISDGIPLAAIRDAAASGHQVFVISPSVKASKAKRSLGVDGLASHLADALPNVSVQGVHGKSKDKRDALDAFRAGTLDVLVATTIVEVGVNVPNATLIVVTGADSFGITQLHQLRGRVGRGSAAGSCVLVPSKPMDELNEDTRRRLEAVRDSTNGFHLAEVDLELRGGGNLSGTHQEGRASDLRIASTLTDTVITEQARADAFDLVASDPMLAAYPMLRSEIEGFIGKEGVKWLETL